MKAVWDSLVMHEKYQDAMIRDTKIRLRCSGFGRSKVCCKLVKWGGVGSKK